MTAAALCALAPVLEGMPDPSSSTASDALEGALAARFGVRHAVSVSSGTAALHTALAAADVGDGDEVLVPAATVSMTVAAVVAVRARPVFVDSLPGRFGMDPTDLRAKAGPRTRAILPVHLFGRTDRLGDLLDLAEEYDLPVIEDACQAQGSRTRGQHAGTIGAIGCFSLKDGKILACGEGGYLLTDDPDLAARAAAYRSHHLTPAPGIAPGSRLGHNFRLAQPLAALAHHNLTGFTAALDRRRQQHGWLLARLAATPGLTAIPHPAGSNRYSPLWHVTLSNPRGFMERLARQGVPNSVGTFGLRAAPEQPWSAALAPHRCPNAAAVLDRLLAVVLSAAQSDEDIDGIANTIDREARAWH